MHIRTYISLGYNGDWNKSRLKYSAVVYTSLVEAEPFCGKHFSALKIPFFSYRCHGDRQSVKF
jgi:hypothetical protein